MKPETININARYYLAPSRVPNADEKAFDVIDRALEYNHRPAVVFSNGTEKECREWVERNCEEPKEHTRSGFEYFKWLRGQPEGMFTKEDCALISTAPKLLALLEQYHAAMPTKESGKLIAEARGWTIQE